MNIYKIYASWALMGGRTDSGKNYQSMSMLVAGDDAEVAIKNLRADLLQNCVEYKYDVSERLVIESVELVGHFRYPKLIGFPKP